MSPTDAFAPLASEANGVVMDSGRLARHAALVAEMNAIIAPAAAARIGFADAPWSLHTMRMQEAAKRGRAEDAT